MTPFLADSAFWESIWKTIINAMLTWLGEAFKWLTDHAAKHGKQILEAGVSSLDWTGMDSYLTAITTKAEQINFFFPLYETIAMMSWLTGFWAALKTIRWLLKFIPFVGG